MCIFGAYRELILIQLYSVKVFLFWLEWENAQGARRKVKNESVLNCKRRHCETVSVAGFFLQLFTMLVYRMKFNI